MASLLPNYNRQTYIANMRAAGVNLSDQQWQAVNTVITEEAAGGDIWSFFRRAIVAACTAVSSLFCGGANAGMGLGERLTSALNLGDRIGGQREVTEFAHRVRDRLLMLGGPIAEYAGLLTGDTGVTRGNPNGIELAGNIRRVALANVPVEAGDLPRGTRVDPGMQYAVTETNGPVAPLNTPAGTRTLTSPTLNA